MEILLLQDVPGVGKKNDLLLVGDGFALNCLLPNRQALVATPTVRKRYAEQIRRRAEENQRELEAKKDAAATISGMTLTFDRKATKTGKLYAAITEKHIVKALKDQHQIEVPENAVFIPEQIKALGEHTISLSLAAQKENLTILVSQEK